MRTRILYRYERQDGKITTSLVKPDGNYTKKYRIIAADGKLVTQDGVEGYSVIDTDSTDGWYEIDDTEIVEVGG